MAVTQSHPSKINLPERSPGFTVSSNASVSPRTPRTPPPTATRLRGYPLRRRASSISSLRSSVSEASVESSELDWSTNEDDNLHRICDEYANESTHTPYADCAPPNQLVHHLAKTARKSKFGPENDRWRHTLRSTRRRINMIMREDARPLYSRIQSNQGLVKSKSTPSNSGMTSPHQRLIYLNDIEDERTPRKLLANITAEAYFSPDKSGLRQALGSISIASSIKSEQPIRRSARHAAISSISSDETMIDCAQDNNDNNKTPKAQHRRKSSNSPYKSLAAECTIDEGSRIGLRPRKR
ncbi:hypothetical protein E3P81_02790 [Wallemia ichthyophaga]|uniref:Uncharacterized protein n=1 Tax=Wallemia ichthyophaga TaxID=245174 RepID=A0A4T0FMT0_WALIC|nr:hypothetical protein E3P97_02913 [Wallemia ichthyophaga]TIB06346.1 hypothetical protein E3P96_00530 [Wallemia ichthyophaga]TIB28403.1 hypothetical protein E3P85_03683 [Wallemia ichthyophaga]TIB40549.1 hypothetical protein E3P86_00630 [Wallemia ichthyophaga]TIB45440.1 hypothetical protein E3P82_02842 [Wallemia ichthyophaga]